MCSSDVVVAAVPSLTCGYALTKGKSASFLDEGFFESEFGAP